MKNLKKYIEENFTFEIELGYKLPLEIQSSRFGRWIMLESFRNERLLRERSGHESRFEYDIGKGNYFYISEFPIPITNRELWQELIQVYSVPPKFHNIFHFSLDYFFPYSSQGIVVEIDGSQYERQREYDQARDDYLQRMYGLNVLRAEQYGDFNPEPSKKFYTSLIQQLDFTFKPIPFPLDFSKDIEWIFMDKYEYIINTIFKIREVKDRKIKNIKLSKREFYILSEGKVSTYTKTIEILNNIFWEIYNQRIEIIL